MDRISFSELMEALASFPVAVWYGCPAALLVFILEIILVQKGILFPDDNRKEKAIQAGHIIKAKKIKMRYKDTDESGKTATRKYYATYEYTVDGAQKTYRVVSGGSEPGFFLSLYYEKTPNKVFSDYDIKPSPFQFVLYLIPLAVAFLVMHLMGFST